MSFEAPVFQRKHTVEYNTSQDSLKQLAQMQWNVDEMFRAVYAGGINTNDIFNIDTLYHYLVFIYADRIHALCWTVLQKELQGKEDKLIAAYYDWKKNNPQKVPTGLIWEMRLYKRWLYEIGQKRLRLGIPTKVEMSAQEATIKAIEG
jgi:hypothetical protein